MLYPADNRNSLEILRISAISHVLLLVCIPFDKIVTPCSAVLMTRHSIRMHQVPLDVATLNTRIIASLSHASLYRVIYMRHIETLVFSSNECVCYSISAEIYLYLYTLNVHQVKKGSE